MQSASASVVAWSPIMATHGSPGRMRIAKKTMLMAPSSIGTATTSRRSDVLEHRRSAQLSTFSISG